MKWINTLPLAKGSSKNRTDAEIQKIVTSAGWLDQCPDGIHIWTLLKSILKKYHFTVGCCCQEKRHRSWLREIKLSCTVGKGVGKDPNQMTLKIVDRSYLEKKL